MTAPAGEKPAQLLVGDDYDVCECGDYRHQHQGGVGRCLLCALCTPTECRRFRLYRRAIKDYPAGAVDEIGPNTPVEAIIPLLSQPRLKNKLRYEFSGRVLQAVLNHTDAELLVGPNFGRKSIKEWHDFIKKHALERYWVHGT